MKRTATWRKGGLTYTATFDDDPDRARSFPTTSALNIVRIKNGLEPFTQEEHLAQIELFYELTDEQREVIRIIIRGAGVLKRRADAPSPEYVLV